MLTAIILSLLFLIVVFYAFKAFIIPIVIVLFIVGLIIGIMQGNK